MKHSRPLPRATADIPSAVPQLALFSEPLARLAQRSLFDDPAPSDLRGQSWRKEGARPSNTQAATTFGPLSTAAEPAVAGVSVVALDDAAPVAPSESPPPAGDDSRPGDIGTAGQFPRRQSSRGSGRPIHLPAGDTRRAARAASAARAPSARERIFASIVAAGDRGATLDSLEVETRLPRSTISGRLTELSAAYRIIDTGRRVPSRYGSPLTIYAAGSGCGCLQ